MKLCKVLFLAANPVSGSALRLDAEAREIEAKIRVSAYRESLLLKTRWAVTPDDLLQALNEDQPTIVHFSGHGTPQGIALDDGKGGAAVIPGEALARLFGLFREHIRLVLLNSCYSEHQALSLVKVIDCVVGMQAPVDDDEATTFAASFYRALGFGRSVKHAYEQGFAAVGLRGNKNDHKPRLLSGEHIDPDLEFLVARENLDVPKENQNKPQSLLWVDDEGEHSLQYEQYMLKRKGWSIHLARSVVDAARLLSEQEFGAIIVDLVLPFSSGVLEPNQGAWGGLALMCWIYGKDLPEEIATSVSLRTLRGISPHPRNLECRVAVGTAYIAEDMIARIDRASPRHVEFLYKPIELPRLLEFLSDA